MFGFGFLLVPFYEKICEVTGLRNIAQADEVRNTQVAVNRKRAHRVRLEPAQPAMDVQAARCPWSRCIPAK